MQLIGFLNQKTLEYGETQVGFAFQGGEPTLAGLDFYRKLLELQQKYNQTNGTLIDADWAELLPSKAVQCGACQFYPVCRGGCRRHHEPIVDRIMHKNYFCHAYQGFYQYALPRFYQIARVIG
jgi:radical SAM protein with 4Fe4S-binding SPASM domain